MHEGLGIDPKRSTEAFLRLDRDRSGVISRDELRSLIKEFYLNGGANAPEAGSWSDA